MLTLIVGLGNPGREYAGTRHNVGFHCLDRLAKAHGIAWKRQGKSITGRGEVAGEPVLLAKPYTFMNLSGQVVGPLLHSNHTDLGHLIVVLDDLDLPVGTIRIRPKGSAGGHKGLLSIIQHLGGRQDFARIRIGIGRPEERGLETVDYVLSRFTYDEEPVASAAIDRAAAAIEAILAQGLDKAMSLFNKASQNDAVE